MRNVVARLIVLTTVGAALAAIFAGCQQAPQDSGAQVPVVPVAHPVDTKDFIDYVDFTGRTNAVNSVNIVPRVTGYLVEMPFKEGSEVKKGDLLFLVDPRPYQDQYDQAVAQVHLNQASLDLAEKTLKRYQDLKKETPGAVRDQDIDQYKAAVEEAKERVNASNKSLEVYQLNKDFTRVVSPINGQVSRYYLTLGNLVNQDQTLLTTVVSLDPMYVYFDMDERTLLRIRTLINEGQIQPRSQRTDLGRETTAAQAAAAFGTVMAAAPGNRLAGGLAAFAVDAVAGKELEPQLPVYMGLQGEDGFPHKGSINFLNNQVNPNTGSISMRGLFWNPKPENGVRLLSPGMFVRIHLPIGPPHEALLVLDSAIQAEQNKKYVYVVTESDGKKVIEQRFVTTGSEQNGRRVITSDNIKPSDWVVYGELQKVRNKMEVKVQEGKMPPKDSSDDSPAGSK